MRDTIPGGPIVSGNGALCEDFSGYVEGIFKSIVQGTPSFCRDTIDFLQKLSTLGPVEPGTFLITVDISALYTSIPHDDGIAATASVLNANDCQFPDAILELIFFLLDHNVFTFNNQFFIQTHGTAMITRFAPQYANIFMHKFEQDFFTEEHDGHLKILKDDHIGTGYEAQFIVRQFRSATAKNHNNLLRRQTQDTTNRVHFGVQYFPGVERLHYLLHSLQHVINDDEHATKIIHTPPLLTFKQPPNLKQTIVCSKVPSLQYSIDYNTTQPCHGNLCKTCQIIDMDTTITHGNTNHHVHGRYSCDSANAAGKDALRH
eukprot:g33749.t1